MSLAYPYTCDTITTIKVMNNSLPPKTRKDHLQIRSYSGILGVRTSAYEFGERNSIHNTGENHLKCKPRIQWFNIYRVEKKGGRNGIFLFIRLIEN